MQEAKDFILKPLSDVSTWPGYGTQLLWSNTSLAVAAEVQFKLGLDKQTNEY